MRVGGGVVGGEGVQKDRRILCGMRLNEALKREAAEYGFNKPFTGLLM